MAKYICWFTLKDGTLARMLGRPDDRFTAVAEAAERAGGRLEAYYWLVGGQDGFVIVDSPDSLAVSAVVLAVASTGAFERLETHELIAAEALPAVLRQAADVRGIFRPPGGEPRTDG